MPAHMSTELRRSAHMHVYRHRRLHTGGVFFSAWRTFLLLPRVLNPSAVISSSSWGWGWRVTCKSLTETQSTNLFLRRKPQKQIQTATVLPERCCLALKQMRGKVEYDERVVVTRIVFYFGSAKIKISSLCLHSSLRTLIFFFFPPIKPPHFWASWTDSHIQAQHERGGNLVN